MDRRNFMQQATRFLVGLAAAPLLKLLPKSKTWTTPWVKMQDCPKDYRVSVAEHWTWIDGRVIHQQKIGNGKWETVDSPDYWYGRVPFVKFETFKQVEAEMDRQTGVMDLETLRRHAPR